MLSNMESDPKTELADVERLGRKARAAATNYPFGMSLVLIVADLALIGVFIVKGLSTPMIVTWIAFLVLFHLVLRLRRPARSLSPLATPESRQRSLKQLALNLAVNAIWIPLFFIARPIALGLLVAVLLYSLFGTLKYRHA